jgi:hypothetical protein
MKDNPNAKLQSCKGNCGAQWHHTCLNTFMDVLGGGEGEGDGWLQNRFGAHFNVLTANSWCGYNRCIDNRCIEDEDDEDMRYDNDNDDDDEEEEEEEEEVHQRARKQPRTSDPYQKKYANNRREVVL